MTRTVGLAATGKRSEQGRQVATDRGMTWEVQLYVAVQMLAYLALKGHLDQHAMRRTESSAPLKVLTK